MTARADERCDLVVAGAGFGGLVAAASAAQRGKSVIVLEAGGRIGGTVGLSSGLMHMYDAPSWDSFRTAFPTVDAVLGRAMYDAFPEFVLWLGSTVGVPMAKVPLPSDPYKDPGRIPQGYVLGVGAGTAAFLRRFRGPSRFMYRLLGEWYLRQLDRTVIRSVRAKVIERLSRALAASSGKVMVDARVEDVAHEADGTYRVVINAPEGPIRIRASTLVLATGGFQGSKDLLEEHLGKGAARAMCRAVRTNRGDGLRIGRSLGGAEQGPMDRFYGYPMAVLPMPIDHQGDPIALLTCSAYYAGNSVLVDRLGKRFADEPALAKGSELSHAIAVRAEGECWGILDERTRQRFAMKEFGGGLLPPINLIKSAASRGALILSAATLEELVTKLGEHGVDCATLTATLRGFNEAVRDHTESQLHPSRSSAGPALEVPPFYAVSLIPGVSMTYGGLRVNERAQVLSAAGTPIPGLFAIPGAAGGLYHRQYGGALAACGTFGRIAGTGCD